MRSAQDFGVATFGRTSASLVNLVLLVVPLMGLSLGASSLAGERERGGMLYLLAQPVTRTELLVAKLLGLTGALTTALLAGFGAAALLVATQTAEGTLMPFVAVAGLAVVLGVVSLGLGMLISALSRKTSAALGAGLFTWLALVFLGDLGLMGTALVLRLDVLPLLGLTLVNPLNVFKIAALLAVRGNLDVLGPGGHYAMHLLGDALFPVLLAILALWTALPVLATWLVFRRQEAV